MPRKKYYDRVVRRNGRPTREYIGKRDDPVVDIIARQDALDRAEQAAALIDVRAEQREFINLEPMLNRLAEYIQELHQYLDPSSEPNMPNCNYTCGHDTSHMPTREHFQYLVAKTKKGDKQAAVELRTLIEKNPCIWKPLSDLSDHIEHGLIEMIAADDSVVRSSLRCRVVQMKKDLQKESSDELIVSLLIDQVIVCWLEAHYAHMSAIQPQRHKRDALFWMDRVERANARYYTAIEKLASVRKTLGCVSEPVPHDPHVTN
jgi:hypothetical protein